MMQAGQSRRLFRGACCLEDGVGRCFFVDATDKGNRVCGRGVGSLFEFGVAGVDEGAYAGAAEDSDYFFLDG